MADSDHISFKKLYGFRPVGEKQMQEKDKRTDESIIDIKSYEAPAIIFETTISTRAGSPIIESDAPQPPKSKDGVDLFPTD